MVVTGGAGGSQVAAPESVREVLSAEEIRSLTRLSDWAGARALLVSWGIIWGSLFAAGWWPSWLTITLALVLLGGRQLGLSILMHEASHRSLFKTRALNDVLGKWLCAAPVWSRLPAYRSHHLQHHNYANSPRDPDLGLVTPFPTSKSSVLRKLARDIFGVTGARRVVGLIAMDLGFLTYTASTGAARKDPLAEGGLSLVIKQALHNLGPVLATNAVMAGLLWWAGIGWTFALWVGAYLTTFSLFLRLRALAEHACTSMVENPFWHTRTTKAHAVARLTVAPHNVNYHLEHHLLMTVPHQSLPRMHALLVERGAIPPARLASGYWEVLRQVSAGRGGAPDASPA